MTKILRGRERIEELRAEGFSLQTAKRIEKGEDYKLRLAEADTHGKLLWIVLELVEDMYPGRSTYHHPM